MSHMFLHEQRAGDANVYVNNMNTQHATLHIPDKNKALRRSLLIKQLALPDRINRLDNDAQQSSYGCGDATVRLTSHSGNDRFGVGAATTDYNHPLCMSRMNTAQSERPNDTTWTTAAGARHLNKSSQDGPLCVTSRLEHAYQRIMRRLQRQLNVENMTGTSLATQFDIAESDVREENDTQDGAVAHSAPSRSTSPLHRDTSGGRSGPDCIATFSRELSLSPSDTPPMPIKLSTSETTATSSPSCPLASLPSAERVVGGYKLHDKQAQESFSVDHSRSAHSSATAPRGGHSNVIDDNTSNSNSNLDKNRNGTRSNLGSATDTEQAGQQRTMSATTPKRHFSSRPVSSIASAFTQQQQHQQQQELHYGYARNCKGGVGSTSMLVCMRTDGPIDGTGDTVPRFADRNTRGATDDSEDEHMLADQPCPMTLRLVVRHVHATLQRKMELAERGSMRDCLCAVFESRALLDRMLKEMPSYMQFHESALSVKERGSPTLHGPCAAASNDRQEVSRVNTRLQQLYRTFRKRPVVLPRGHYVEDDTTGAVHAELDVAPVRAIQNSSNGSDNIIIHGSSHDAPSRGSGEACEKERTSSASPMRCQGETRMHGVDERIRSTHIVRSNINNTTESTSPLQHGNASSLYTPSPTSHAVGRNRMHPSASVSGSMRAQRVNAEAHSAPVVALPLSYGRSARLEARAAGSGVATDEVAGARCTRTALSMVTQIQTHQSSVSSAERGLGSMDAACNDRLDLGNNTNTDESEGTAMLQGSRRPVSQKRTLASAHEATIREKCRATQRCDVGTLTELSALTTVTAGAYEQLRQYAQKLEAQLYMAEQAREGAMKELHAEQGGSARSARVVRYLRRTLVQECNTLRSQLHFAALQQQQQQQASLKSTSLYVGASSGASTDCISSLNCATPNAQIRRGMQSALHPCDTSCSLLSTRSSLSTRMGQRASQALLAADTKSNQAGSEMPLHALGGRGGSTTTAFRTDNTHSLTVANGCAVDMSAPLMPRRGPASMRYYPAMSANDITAIQSLLDLVLLTVEEEGSLPLEMALAPAVTCGCTDQYNECDNGRNSNSVAAIGRASARGGVCARLDSNGMSTSSARIHSGCKEPSDASTTGVNSNELSIDARTHSRHRNCAGKDTPIGGVMVAPRLKMRQLRADFEEKQRLLKESMVAMRVQQSLVLCAKNKEIERLQRLSDGQFINTLLIKQVQTLRMDCRKLRNHVHEQMHTFHVHLLNAMNGLLMRTQATDCAIAESTSLLNTQQALKDMIVSARDLLLPMLTPEYARGYHPWALKTRNTNDPLAHMLKKRYGRAEMVRLREELSAFSEIYLAIHGFVVKQVVVPDITRPEVGQALRHVCAALSLAAISSAESVFAVRLHYAEENRMCAELAQLNARILWNAYLQRAYVERSIDALIDVGLDYNTIGLPVAPSINKLAALRETMLRERVLLQRARMNNAKNLYALWREKQINIFEYYPLPTQQNKLSLHSPPENRDSALMSMTELGPRGAVSRALNAIYKAST